MRIVDRLVVDLDVRQQFAKLTRRLYIDMVDRGAKCLQPLLQGFTVFGRGS
jgi:hypothetical protein